VPRLAPKDSKGALATNRLLLSPFCGRPACQYIDVSPGKQRPGVCADAYLARRTVLVTNVHQHPGHIACDGRTKSEIVCPLLLERGDGDVFVVGVLDLDCLAFGGFDLDDQEGLENIAKLLVEACDW
jgi:L-methionine (R)-S-oxide reductase